MNDALQGLGLLISVGAFLVSWRAHVLGRRALRVSQDPTVFNWLCELDEIGFPARLINATTTVVHHVRVVVVVDGEPQPEAPILEAVSSYGVVGLDLQHVARAYLDTLRDSPATYSSTMPGPRLAASSIRFHIGVSGETPAGAARHQEFEVDVVHGIVDGRVVREIHDASGRILDPYRSQRKAD